jgi:hypothetical protein
MIGSPAGHSRSLALHCFVLPTEIIPRHERFNRHEHWDHRIFINSGAWFALLFPLIFSKKHAGKWVASKNNTVVETNRSRNALVKKVASRKDKNDIVFDLVPSQRYIA